nr:hypothetical protein [Tanacetum cinerariifolium]
MRKLKISNSIWGVPDEDDDMYTEPTPLARKVPVVDYEIEHFNNKPHYKIIRTDGTHQLHVSFITLLKNFDREDLEALWSIFKERFSTSKPKNFSDDYLLTTLRAMRYPLSRFRLDQMLNAVRLRVEEQKLSAAKQKLMLLDSAAERRLMLLSQDKTVNNNEDGNSSRAIIKQALGRKSYALSWKPYQGDSLNPPDHRFQVYQGRLLTSFQDDAKYEHGGQDTRLQDGKDNQDEKDKDLEISNEKTKSKDNHKWRKIKDHQA